jgi:hypothetical protein
MDYPYANYQVRTNHGTIAIDANVQAVINAIDMCKVIPYGDFGGAVVYYFQTNQKCLGNLVYTIFDRNTTLGLASFAVRYGSAASIRQVIFEEFPRTQIDLQFLILPCIPSSNKMNGIVIP